jgi:TonB-linked SusC/RagA family outer membrane protein
MPLMLYCFFMAITGGLYAQDSVRVAVSGYVKDNKGSPLYGAVVKEKGSATNGTTTDAGGYFQLTVKKSKAVLQVSHVGYKRMEVTAAGGQLLLTMEADESVLSEAVVIGYQNQKRRNVTAAVSSINGKDIADIPAASFDKSLQGRLAGVSVLSSSGETGSRTNIVIRGATNVDYGNANGGNTGPLYVIDGVIFDLNAMASSYSNTDPSTGFVTSANNPLSLINPNDIESIDVLKDASASAIYGARAGNGVIIVKTKKARMGKPQLTGSVYAGVTSRPNFRKVDIGAAERKLKLDLLYAQLPYANVAASQIPIQLTDSLNPAFNNSVDWQGLLVRDQAIVNSQDVALAGYMGMNNYRVSFNHYNEQGVLNGYGLERFAPHLNLTIHPLNRMSVTADILLSSEKRMHGIGGSVGQLFTSWNFPTSFTQLTDEQRKVYSGKMNYYDDNKIFSLVGSVNLLDTLVNHVTFNSNFSTSIYNDRYDYFSPKTLNGLQNAAYSVQSNNPGWSFENYLSYSNSVKEHHFTLSAGTSAYSNRAYSYYASAKGINVSGISTIQTVPSGANLFASSVYQRKTTVSYYGRLIYDYDGKYLLTASLRRDASSIYSAAYRWGTFPSVSLGWIASDEPFFKSVSHVINFAKVRVSWGVTGLDPGNWYSKYQPLYNDASYLLGTTSTIVNNGSYSALGGTPSTYNGTTAISPFPYYNYIYSFGVKSSKDVRWEKYPQTDIGLDMEFLNNRIALTMDVYRKDAKDKYFYNVPAQATSGYQYYSGNMVDIRNQGLEIAINTRNLSPRSAFQWNTSFNISFNRNKATRLPDGNKDFLVGASWFQQTFTYGEPLFNYKVYQINGVFANEKDVPVDPITGKSLTFQGATLHAGDAKYVDNNGDYNIDYDDKVIAGNPMPKVTGGFSNNFSYKRFNLTVFCSFLTGRKIFNGALSDFLNGSRSVDSWGFVAGPAAIPNMLNQFWNSPGDQTRFPRLVYPSGTAQDPWNIASSYFVEDGSFLKVRTIQLGYSLPDALLRRMHMRRINVYTMLDNVHIFKKSKTIADPELVEPTTGSSNIVYPSALKITLGANFEL